MKNTLLVGTRKGLAVFHRNGSDWKMKDLHFEAVPVSIAYADERTNTWWACLDHGHWGVKLSRSKDAGKTWEEIPAPAYAEGLRVKEGMPATTRYLWAVQHGGKKYPNRLWIGTEPGGLFKSEDGGDSFQLVESLWNHPSREEQWFGGGRDHAGIHSIVVDPRDENHIYVGISVAGVFESKDGGTTWTVRNKGLKAEYLPDPYHVVPIGALDTAGGDLQKFHQGRLAGKLPGFPTTDIRARSVEICSQALGGHLTIGATSFAPSFALFARLFITPSRCSRA